MSFRPGRRLVGAGIVAGAAMGAFIGALAFRYGLKGSYFALVTLAFAEVLRRARVSVTLRREKGHDIDAACGQLRLKTEKDRELADAAGTPA